MTKRDQSVKTYSGTPPATAFGASQGTPLVIDYTAAIGYFMHPTTGAVTALGGGGGGSGITQLTGDVLAGPGSGSQVASFNLTVQHEWQAKQGVVPTALTDAATISPNGALSNNAYLLCTVAVGATRTINTPTGMAAGDYWTLEVEQPVAGGCAVVFASGFKWGVGGLDLQPGGSTTGSAVDLYAFQKQSNGNFHGVIIGNPSGQGYRATSTTSLVTAGSGSKVFTTQAGLAYSAGARVRATSAGTSEYMEGLCISYSGTTLTVTMDTNSGTGTHADWNINLAGNPGINGAPGSSGPVLVLTNNATQSPPSNTATKVLFQVVTADTAGGWSTLNNRYTPNVAGYYFFDAKVRNNVALNGATFLGLFKNGSNFMRGASLSTTSTTTQWIAVTGLVLLNGTSDFVELFATINATTPALDFGSGDTSFTAHWVHS